MRERSLVVFTLMMQTAAGALLALVGLSMLPSSVPAEDRLYSAALLGIVPLLGAGLLAAFFHLGRPPRAWRALANLRSSWLSREILLALLFSGSAALFICANARLAWAPALPEALLGWLAAGLGVGLVYSMARVYLLRTAPGWNVWSTPLSFALAALLLGALAGGGLLALAASLPAAEGSAAGLELVSADLRRVAVLGLLLVVSELGMAALQPGQRPGRETPGLQAAGAGSPAFGLRVGLLLACAAALGAVLAARGNPPGLAWLIWAAFGLALAAHVLARAWFYQLQAG